MLVGGTRQPAQAPPSSPRMVWERGPVASGSASRPAAASSSAVEYSSGKASIGARVGCVAAAYRRRSVSALLQAQVAVFRGSAVSGGRRVAGARVLRPLLEAPPICVVNRGGRVGRKSFPPAGAAPVRGRSLDGGGGHRVDHQIGRAVLARRLARCRGQRSSPWVLILQVMREPRRG